MAKSDTILEVVAENKVVEERREEMRYVLYLDEKEARFLKALLGALQYRAKTEAREEIGKTAYDIFTALNSWPVFQYPDRDMMLNNIKWLK